MKVLFLDIDGVLNSEATFRKRPEAHFPTDPYMVLLLDRIITATGCKVVLSSSWRGHPDSVEFIEKNVCPLIGKTGYDSSGIRGKEIHDWLVDWYASIDPVHTERITQYAILDDSSDMLQEQLPNFFRTQWQVGLTDEIAEKVIEHLGKL